MPEQIAQSLSYSHVHLVEVYVDGILIKSKSRRLTGLQIRELGQPDRIHGFKTEVVTGHVRVIGDHEEIEVHQLEHFRTIIEIYLDCEIVISCTSSLTGIQIRELGPPDRVNGFETQQIDAQGRKIRTIGDREEIKIREHERFRTVPNHGGPGATIR